MVWRVQPDSLPVKGTIYSDGSARDGPIKELVRCGWSFAVVDDDGRVIAAAYGLPPPWIEDIGGQKCGAIPSDAGHDSLLSRLG